MRETQAGYQVSDGILTVGMPGMTAEVGRLSLSAARVWSLGAQTGLLAFVTPLHEPGFPEHRCYVGKRSPARITGAWPAEQSGAALRR